MGPFPFGNWSLELGTLTHFADNLTTLPPYGSYPEPAGPGFDLKPTETQ